MIGIAPTGQGKTIVFLLPALLMALEQEMNMPVYRGEGPLAVIIVPSVKRLIIPILKVQQYLFLCFCLF